ncbi:MAG: type III pantothenate kinase [Nitrospiria bacterium]
MLLAIDVGNTDIVFGVFQGQHLIGTWRVSSNLRKTSDEYGVLIRQILNTKTISPASVNGVIISSVVPPLTSVFQEMSVKHFSIKPMIVSESIDTGLRIEYAHPEEIGSDRIVNAAAAYHLYGGPALIIDLGTATTFCVVTEKGAYKGGAIAPGMMLSAEALYKHTAKLPKIQIAKPNRVIGNDTAMSMQSGIFFGYIGLIDEIVRRIHREIDRETLVVATGGLADLVAPECRTVSKIRSTLTLEGLMIIYNMNA